MNEINEALLERVIKQEREIQRLNEKIERMEKRGVAVGVSEGKPYVTTDNIGKMESISETE